MLDSLPPNEKKPRTSQSRSGIYRGLRLNLLAYYATSRINGRCEFMLTEMHSSSKNYALRIKFFNGTSINCFPRTPKRSLARDLRSRKLVCDKPKLSAISRHGCSST